YLLHEDDCRDHAHPGQAHDAEGEERHHQAPAAADAVETVFDAHPQGTGLAVSPAAEHEMKRTPAMAQADLLQRRQLVQPREGERAAGDVAPAPVPVEELRG